MGKFQKLVSLNKKTGIFAWNVIKDNKVTTKYTGDVFLG